MDLINLYESLQYKQLVINKTTVDKYKHIYSGLKHIIIDDNHNGIVYINNGEVVGFINVDNVKHSIQALELNPKYQRQWLGSKMLKYSINNLKADNLSVRQKKYELMRLKQKIQTNIDKIKDYI